MPAISLFYGIIISLYFYDDERYKLPHIHAKYQGMDASFSILDGSFWPEKSLLPKFDWFRHGSKFIASLCWPIGNLQSMDKLHSP
jgi:hypothetical protein